MRVSTYTGYSSARTGINPVPTVRLSEKMTAQLKLWAFA